MENETEVIKQQMEETRTALSEKLEAVEELVASTVKETTQTVTDTVAAVTNTVESTVNNVSESVTESVENVKQALDLSSYVDQHPWLVMGGAVALGYTIGSMLGRGNGSPGPYSGTAASAWPDSPSWTASPPAATSAQRTDALPPSSSGAAPVRQEPSAISSMLEGMMPLVDKFKGLAIGTAASLVADMVIRSVPDNLKSHVSEMIDDATRALGGTDVRHH